MASTRIDLSDALWFKSSYSNESGGNCVEVAANLPGLVPVRDSKAPNRPALILTAPAWTPFITALKTPVDESGLLRAP
ncbi:DUF397 domain-containing protein [Streptomyces sp. NBC_00988]|uniref:DUF397 domain-containing protein n=1 Tax=Streptomyces sp. NBC_00988 TaxID=2903704 RepID=UPI00386F7107|nr:DUF397 domain-containing protein [Streptomyces sp. NBC_00988]